MRRREFAAALLLGPLAATRAAAYTPYRQWQVYRRKHLLIGCHKEDMASYALAKRMVAVLDVRLPTARARVARGPTPGRIASLIATGQMDVALLGDAEAVAMANGVDGFEPYGAIALRVLVRLPERVLVARADFPDHHAWLVSNALDGQLTDADAADLPDIVLEWHPGADRRRRGLSTPETGRSGETP